MKLKSYFLASLVLLSSLVGSQAAATNEWSIDKGINITYHWYNPDNKDFNDIHPFVTLRHESGFNASVFIDSFNELNTAIGYRWDFSNDVWATVDASFGYSEEQLGFKTPVMPQTRLGYKNVWIAPGLVGWDIKW